MSYFSYLSGHSNPNEVRTLVIFLVVAVVLGIGIGFLTHCLVYNAKIGMVAGLVAALLLCFGAYQLRVSKYIDLTEQLATINSYRLMRYNTKVDGQEQLSGYTIDIDVMYQKEVYIDKTNHKIIVNSK